MQSTKLNFWGAQKELSKEELLDQRVTKTVDSIVAALSKSKVPMTLDDLKDAFEVQCEDLGLSRAQRRDDLESLFNYYGQAILRLGDKLKKTSDTLELRKK